MKRKVKRGLKILSQLIDGVVTIDNKEVFSKSSPINLDSTKHADKNDAVGIKSFLVYMIYVYRAYGFIVQGEYEVIL